MLRLTALVLGVAAAAFAVPPVPFHFVSNTGQLPSDVRYVAPVRNAAVFLTDAGVAIDGPARLTLYFEGSNSASRWTASATVPGTTTYMVGNDPTKWRRNVPHYSHVERRQVYPGIDVVAYGAEGRFEYDFVLAPHADPARIRLRFDAAAQLHLLPNGDLQARAGDGEYLQRLPAIYQTSAGGVRHRVEGRYRLLPGNRVAFDVGPYDRARALTIDPVLESATLLGGAGAERLALADPTAFVVGSTVSADFPGVPVGPHSRSDVFFYNPTSQSTYIVGGTGDDIVTCAHTVGDLNGYVAIGGYTDSRDLPVKSNVYGAGVLLTKYGGGEHDGFLMIASRNGTVLVTYFGASGDDRILAVEMPPTLSNEILFGGSTTSTDLPVTQAWQSTLSGGVDGFAGAYSLYAGALSLATYIGGPDDDRVLAIAGIAGTDLYVAGETRSAEGTLPGSRWSGARRGASDGFLLRANRAVGYTFPYVLSAGAYWGGSDEDRVTHLRPMPDGRIAVAGQTASADFAAPTALQGPSDAFLAVVAADLSVSWTRLIGGSGADEPLAIATGALNDLLLGGVTTSTDFPVKDAIQSKYAGGASDGFLLHVDGAGETIWSSYYGGSGEDRVTSVRFENGPRVFFGGTTDSNDLPLNRPLQSENTGGGDIFIGSVIVPVIRAREITGGKDLAAPGYALLGDAETAVGSPLTVTSSDPANLLVAARADELGQASVTVSARATGVDLAGRNFFVYCLTDSGARHLTLSAPGYPDRVVAVRCVPGALVVSNPEIAVRTNGDGTGGGSFTLATAALDPAASQPIRQNPRGGIGPIRFEAASSDSTILSLIETSAVFNPAAAQDTSRIGFRTAAIGAAEIVLTTSSPFAFAPSDRVRVRVTGPAITMYVPTMARDFASRMAVTLSPTPAKPIDVTLTTSDSSKIRISSWTHTPGADSYVVTCAESCSAAYLEALDGAGPVSITASAPGLDPITVPVALVDPVLRIFDSRSSQPLVEQATYSVGSFTANVYLGAASSPVAVAANPAVVLRQGAAPIEIRLASSNPDSISVSDQPFRIGPGGPLYGVFPVTTKAGGQSALTASVSGGMTARSLPVTVVVLADRLTVSPATLGANLQIAAPIAIPYSPVPGAVTITSSDPSRLVISDDPTRLGTGVLAYTVNVGRPLVLQALGGTGSVELTASSATLGDSKATIRIVPSGISWTTESLAGNTFDTPGKNQTAGPSLAAYALDPENLAPLVLQSTRPGVEVALESSDPSVAAPVSASVSLDQTWRGYGATVGIEVAMKAPGETQFAIRQPAGFVNPAGRKPLRVRVGRPTFRLNDLKLGRFAQAETSAYFPQRPPEGSPLPPMTVTSSDPSRLLLSATATDPGAATATVRPPFDGFPPGGSPYQPFYVQAIGEPADVKITASVPGFEDATIAVEIVPMRLAMATYSGALTTNRAIQTDTQANPIQVTLFALPQDGVADAVSDFGRAQFWPGFPATTVPIASSNPAVAVVEKNPTLNARTGSATFFVRPLTAGETELSFTPPPGFSPVPSGLGQKLKVVVAGPTLALPDFPLGRDLTVGATFAVLNGPAIPASDVEVTVTSSDPSKVLLSAAASQAGAASVTIRIPGNRPITTAVYVHALDETGSVTLQTSAPGYGSRASTVTVAPLQFTADPGYSLSVQLQQPQTVTLRPGPGAPQQGYVAQLRPGAAPFPIEAVSRNPEILTVSPARITAAPGDARFEFKVEGVAAGETSLAFTVPAPYKSPTPIPITVRGGSLYLSGDRTLGKNLQTAFNTVRAPLTVTSSDPSRLLVSATPGGVGAASAAITEGRVYANALSDSGTVKLTVSGPGYTAASAEVILAPALVVISYSSQSSSLSTLSPPLPLRAILTAKDANGAQSLRPGAAAVVVPITLSDPNVGSVSPAQLTFNPGDSTAAFTFTPRAAGSELISLGVPSGFGDPLSGGHLLLTVTAARFTLTGSLSVGKDLQTQVTANLPGVAGQPVSVELGSSDPSRLVLGLRRDALSPSATLSFNSTTQSLNVYLAGLASSGSATLTATAGALPPTSYTVTLQPSGFRFGSGSTTVNAGSSTSVQIYSSMLSPSLSPAGDYPVRPDLPAQIPLTVTSSNPGVVASPAGPIYFNPGDAQQRLTISGRSPGVATLTLTPPEGWSIPAGANRITVIVQ